MSLSTWCHHSLLKPTASVNFTTGRLAKGATNQKAREILRDLTRVRIELLNLLDKPSTNPDKIVEAMDNYLSLASGLLVDQVPTASSSSTSSSTTQPSYMQPSRSAPRQYPVDGDSTSSDNTDNTGGDTNSATGPSTDAITPDMASRKRNATMFKWRDTVSKVVKEYTDIQAEITCMLINVGLWYCLHAEHQGTDKKAREDEESSKKIYHAYRHAASYFEHVARDQLKKLQYEPNTDFDERIIQAMGIQCLAEAQEVTTERAQRKGYKPNLIAGLARDEYDRFSQALAMISTMDQKNVYVLKAYLEFKAQYYAAFALCYTGKHLFQEEKCGNAVKALRQAKTELDNCKVKAQSFRKALSKAGMDQSKKVELGDGFTELERDIRIALEKAEHENGFIYHHKIPVEDEQMLPAHSLVDVPVYQAPELSPMWEEAKFDVKKIPLRGQDKAADLASSDDEKIQSGRNHVSGKHDECVIL